MNARLSCNSLCRADLFAQKLAEDETLHTGHLLGIGFNPSNYKAVKQFGNRYRQIIRLKKEFVATARGELDGAKREFASVKNVDVSRVSVVGVHLRRGDYNNRITKNLGLQILGEKYISRAMNRMKQILSGKVSSAWQTF